MYGEDCGMEGWEGEREGEKEGWRGQKLDKGGRRCREEGGRRYLKPSTFLAALPLVNTNQRAKNGELMGTRLIGSPISVCTCMHPPLSIQ